jgi:hypothetical protein
VALQLLDRLLLISLLMELLRRTRWARIRGEEVITNAHRHAGEEGIKRIAAHAIDEIHALHVFGVAHAFT